ncbi:MAG: preprotein translocase subunit SecE [Epulopiscium sp. Nele67-Bin005]|nr:MAG: preprotein translocase subunit SecE [Epulopiscium sp. Nele67-Bin005]
MGEFFKDFIAESKRIIWPSRQELLSKTGIVITTCVVTACILFGMDLFFSQGISLIYQLVR